MALRSKMIPMPDKKITYKNGPNGTLYVYYTVRAYRNHAGKPTSDEVAIGKKDTHTGMLIPNQRYFELFPETVSLDDSTAWPIESGKNSQLLKPSGIANYGNVYALFEMAKQTGLQQTLQICFPAKWPELLATAFYMVCAGNVMMYIEDWFDETKVSFTAPIKDQTCSRLFASITDEEKMIFFAEWLKCRSEQEYIAYDVTSISTYAHGIDGAEWGYNRDREKLRQVNLGMFYGASSSLPVFYNMYNGSITDKTHLAFMLKNTRKLGLRNVRFVLDRGFVTDLNFSYMQEKGYKFITAFPGQRLDFAMLVDEYRGSVRKSSNRISEYEMYGLPVDYDANGVKMKAHIFFDPDKQALDEKELYAHLERLARDLKQMGKTMRATKKYTDYFEIKQEKAKNFDFRLDNDKVDEELSRTGFFILLSNDLSLDSSDVLRIYRGRDIIEKNFDDLKNGLDFKRLHTHISRTTEGKVFVGFLALILRSHLSFKIKTGKDTKHLTMEKVLLELRKIKQVRFPDMSSIVMPLTKLQRTILAVLELSEDALLHAT